MNKPQTVGRPTSKTEVSSRMSTTSFAFSRLEEVAGGIVCCDWYNTVIMSS